MEETIHPFKHIRQYCEKHHVEPLHPLITVIEFDKVPPSKREGFRRICSYYSIHLKGTDYQEVYYGGEVHQYEHGGIVFVAPGQVFGIKSDGKMHQPKGWALLFHPDFIRGTFLEPLFRQYTYFSYDAEEALFPTTDETALFIECLKKIERELQFWAKTKKEIGKAWTEESEAALKNIVIDLLKLTLDYCKSFYNRQFASAPTQNLAVLNRFEQLMDEYYNQGLAKTQGVLTVKYCADKLCFSTNYFSDLIRKETGVSALKHIHRKALEKAKELLAISNNSISQISEFLGFQFSQHFSKWFKQQEGVSPSEYRKKLSGNNSFISA